MPLFTNRLRESRCWSVARRRPELGFYMVNLWSAAWHHTPAGSLEDDDGLLCDAAMCDPKVWPTVRDEVMCGWLRCTSDGRLYHPVVCEVATTTWEGRKAYRAKMTKARAAKTAKRTTVTIPVEPTLAESELRDDESNNISLPQSVDNSRKPVHFCESPCEQPSIIEHKMLFEEGEVRKKKGESPLISPRKKMRRTRLDPQWVPSEAGRAFAMALSLDPDVMVLRFRRYYGGVRGNHRSNDWGLDWENYCEIGADLFRHRAEKPQKDGKMDWMRLQTLQRYAEEFGGSMAA